MGLLSALLDKSASGQEAVASAIRLGAGLSTDPVRDTAAISALDPASPELIRPDDFPRLRERLRTGVLESVKNMRPIANARFTLLIEDPKLDAADYNREDEKQARMQGTSLTEKLTGVYVLRDLAGTEIRRSGRKTVMNVPYLTEQGTFIRNGTPYSISNQFRQRPGPYTKITADGYPETLFNAKPGTGSSVRMWLDPETAQYYMQLDGHKVAAYPVLKRMGVPESQMKASWGEDIYKKNAEARVAATATNYLDQLRAELRTRGAKPLATLLEDREELPSPPEQISAGTEEETPEDG